jgi:hypothetical protein
MPSNLTKSAVLIAMRIAEDEGDHAEWTVLDRLFASMATGGTLTLAAAASSLALAGLDPYDLDHGDPGESDAVLPAWATPSVGGRGA